MRERKRKKKKERERQREREKETDRDNKKERDRNTAYIKQEIFLVKIVKLKYYQRVKLKVFFYYTIFPY